MTKPYRFPASYGSADDQLSCASGTKPTEGHVLRATHCGPALGSNFPNQGNNINTMEGD